MKKIIKKNKAFTLVELLVVIAIIGVLTTVLMVNFVGSRERARDSQKIQNLKSTKNVLRMYYNDNQSYPVNSSELVSTYMNQSTYDEIDGYEGYEYTQLDSGDGFRIVVTLESGAGIEWSKSQLNCGIETPEENVYAVCST